MKILFLTPWYPYPPDNGIKIRLYNLLRVLGQRHEITLLSFVRAIKSPDSTELRFCRAVQTVPWIPFEPRRVRSVAHFFAAMPRSYLETYNPAMTKLVRAAGEFDVVIASTTDVALYALEANARVRVLEEHNSMTRWMYEQYCAQTQSLRRARYWLTYWKHRRFETWLYAQFDACTVVSELDARVVREWLAFRKPLAVIPNAMDSEYYRPLYQPRPNTLIFNGSLTYEANREAMQFFKREIWEQIRAAVPGVTLSITGRSNGVQHSIAGEGITFTGYLDDIRPAVGQAWACVVPLRTGSGTRLKILEAMALGTPVIATSKGAEGLDVTHGKDILLADTPIEFATQTITLLHDADLRARLARHARHLIETRYNWATSGKQFEAFVCQRLAQKVTR